ncbi:hypothetical protein [Nocardia sp. NPDC048505]
MRNTTEQAQNRAARRGAKNAAVRSIQPIQPTGRLNNSRRPAAAPRRSAY